MAVLGSRTHYCINKTLDKEINKNDACQELLDTTRGCFLKNNANALSSRFSTPKKGKHRIWDMEDLVAAGSDMSGMFQSVKIKTSTVARTELLPEELT